MAIRVFCHGTDPEENHRIRCGEYLRLRHRTVGEKLLDTGDLVGLRVCMENGFFPEEDRGRLLSLAVAKGQMDCLGVLLAADHSMEISGRKQQHRQSLCTRVLTLLGRKFDRYYPWLGQIFHLLLPARTEGYVARLGTDGFSLCLQETSFLHIFEEDSERCQRDVAHVLLHQNLFHPFYARQIQDKEIWDICCDCVAEWILEKRLGYERTASAGERRQRTEVYRFLEKEKLVSAAVLYRRLQGISQEQQQGLGQLFVCDDHQLWYRGEHSTEQWKNQIRRQDHILC